MKEIYVHVLTVFMGFFAIMNPIANVPIFLGLTEGRSQKTTKKIALRSVILAFIIVAIFAVAGKLIFELFGITLPALRITGGLLVGLIGFNMLHGKQSRTQHIEETEDDQNQAAALSIAISPLAMPILAGPGTIATAMNFSAHGGFTSMLFTLSAFAILCAITYLLFVSGERFVNLIGSNALGVITRLMGLILAVIGTQMAIEGIQQAFKMVE